MFEGVKILSFTHFLQGPSAVQMLADLGADVIKIEPPKGAWERHWAGFDAFIESVSVFFMLGNRNQRSLSIDLRAEGAKEIIYRLVKEADVLVENYRPGVMNRLGFGYETLKEINPRLIYCSCTGYGSDGPYLDRPGQDLLLQSMSGLAMLSGAKDAPPTPVGSAIVDQHAAVLAAFGIAAALHQREKTGKGRQVESNLLNAALDLQIEPLTYYLNKGPLWERSTPAMGSRFHPAPYGVYQTKDGWIAISLTPIEKMAKALGVEALAGYSEKDQTHKREEIHAIVYETIKQKTTREWYAIFDEHDIWYAPVNGYEEVEKDPQVAWNKMIMNVEHPDVGSVRLLAHPVRYDGEAPPVRRHPPRIGEHTRDVLKEHGLSETEIERLIKERVVNAPSNQRAVRPPDSERRGTIMNLLRFGDIPIGKQEVTVRAITEELVNSFAQLSGDLNPLHIDERFARTTPFGRRVAHGMLTAAIVSTTHTKLTGHGFVYIGQELNFKAPVFIGDTLTVTLTVAEKKEVKRILVLDTLVLKQDGTTVLQGRSALKELALADRS